jgi:hypothetical protein
MPNSVAKAEVLRIDRSRSLEVFITLLNSESPCTARDLCRLYRAGVKELSKK